jgi:hypothetical protein
MSVEKYNRLNKSFNLVHTMWTNMLQRDYEFRRCLGYSKPRNIRIGHGK